MAFTAVRNYERGLLALAHAERAKPWLACIPLPRVSPDSTKL